MTNLNRSGESRQFTIGGGNDTFIDKQNILFQQLNDAERLMKRNQQQAQIEQICDEPERTATPMKKFRGKESIFKRPEAPISQCLLSRKQPDFKKNPHKWIKYSLEDISHQDLSERSNTSAALTFLREMEDRRDSFHADQMEVGVSDRILFNKERNRSPKYNKSIKVKIMNSSKECFPENSSFKSTKVIMPEYVVGQPTKQHKKTQKNITNFKGKELKLTHLLEVDDDDDN